MLGLELNTSASPIASVGTSGLAVVVEQLQRSNDILKSDNSLLSLGVNSGTSDFLLLSKCLGEVLKDYDRSGDYTSNIQFSFQETLKI